MTPNNGKGKLQSYPWLFLLLAGSLQAAVEDNAVISLDSVDGRVVVRDHAGELQVLRIGDAFPDSTVIIKQVLHDRVIAEEITGDETRVRQMVWVYKADEVDATSRVVRLLESLPPEQSTQPDRLTREAQ
jgi:acetyl-CoA carboxylase carboxyltransferase component